MLLKMKYSFEKMYIELVFYLKIMLKIIRERKNLDF